MSDVSKILNTLYDNTDEPEPSESRPEIDEAARGLYDSADELPIAERQALVSRDQELRLAGVGKEARTKLTRDSFRAVRAAGFDDFSLPARRIFNGLVDAELAEARGRELPRDEAEQQRVREQVRDEIHTTYGEVRGERLIDRTRRFVASQSELRASIERAGLMDDRELMMALLEHVHRTDWK